MNDMIRWPANTIRDFCTTLCELVVIEECLSFRKTYQEIAVPILLMVRGLANEAKNVGVLSLVTNFFVEVKLC